MAAPGLRGGPAQGEARVRPALRRMEVDLVRAEVHGEGWRALRKPFVRVGGGDALLMRPLCVMSCLYSLRCRMKR